MRAAPFLVILGVLGCATAPPAPTPSPSPAKAATAPPADGKKVVVKKEVVVIGKGPAPIPGLRSTEQDTEFTIYHGVPYRCTKVKGSPENPRGEESCRALSSGAQGDPDDGLIDRGSHNIRR